MNTFLERLAREPVLAGAAAIAWFDAAAPHAAPATKLAVGATVALFQRAFSTSKRTVDETLDQAQTAARAGALAEVAELSAPVKPRRARGATKKAPPA